MPFKGTLSSARAPTPLVTGDQGLGVLWRRQYPMSIMSEGPSVGVRVTVDMQF